MAVTVLLPKILETHKINLITEPSIAVIIPTYCEAENVESLIRQIQTLNLNVRIIVVDDSSPDQTQQIVNELNKEFENILLVSRPKKLGLGTAITAGFRHALELDPIPDFIITMDSDFSHNPKDIPRLVDFAKKGYNLVVGSRYISGGKMKNWPLSRKIISRFANMLATGAVGLRLNDFTSGFRCYSKNYIKEVLSSLHSTTYEIQIETIRQAHLNEFQVKEIPITFINRTNGSSKLSSAEFLGFITYVTKAVFSNFTIFLKTF